LKRCLIPDYANADVGHDRSVSSESEVSCTYGLGEDKFGRRVSLKPVNYFAPPAILSTIAFTAFIWLPILVA
jgi:hypothetical protein